jgi:hypothetical protein
MGAREGRRSGCPLPPRAGAAAARPIAAAAAAAARRRRRRTQKLPPRPLLSFSLFPIAFQINILSPSPHTRRLKPVREQRRESKTERSKGEGVAKRAKRESRQSPIADRPLRPSCTGSGRSVRRRSRSHPDPLLWTPLNTNRWLTLLRRAAAAALGGALGASAGAGAATAGAATADAAAAAGARTRRRSGSRAPSWAASCSR